MVVAIKKGEITAFVNTRSNASVHDHSAAKDIQ